MSNRKKIEKEKRKVVELFGVLVLDKMTEAERLSQEGDVAGMADVLVGLTATLLDMVWTDRATWAVCVHAHGDADSTMTTNDRSPESVAQWLRDMGNVVDTLRDGIRATIGPPCESN